MIVKIGSSFDATLFSIFCIYFLNVRSNKPIFGYIRVLLFLKYLFAS